MRESGAGTQHVWTQVITTPTTTPPHPLCTLRVHICKQVLGVKWSWAIGSDDFHFQLPCLAQAVQ